MTLERSIIPIHYNLKIVPCPVDFTFLGECSIEICIAEPAYGITLNAKELNIQTATARDQLGYSVTATSVSYNVEEEAITLEFPEILHVSTSWILDVTYIGLVNDKLIGFYRSVYTDTDHNVHQLTTTQFQSTHARRAFPCWDEPSIKATFTLTLIAPQGMTCLSNMSVESTSMLENGMQEVTFLKTPIMATYLLAWTIGDFDYIEAYTSGEFSGEQVPCRLYAPVGLARHGQYSLDLAVQSVEYFSRLFNIPYPLPKLDLVAVPDFALGAMENWGLITFRTYAVLLDEYGTNDSKREIASTVIHEISHQWFGNLVTMDWWSDLWLFEGFATHLAYIVIDELFPGWDIWSEFVKRIQEVLKHDALRTSHPVEVGVANPGEITQIFDEVSYMKGASVLRMLGAWLGQDQLLKGIRKFMLKYMWGNANTEDLWVTMAEECNVDVPGFMRKWTRQTGYPVLSITELDESTIVVRQNLFLSTGDVHDEEDTLLWPVPLAVATANDPTPRNIMLNTKEMILKVDTTKWYKFNMGQTGFYRVAYPPKTLDLLGQTLGARKGHETLDAANRIGLLTDAAALVASGHTPTSSFLTLLKYFEDEEDYMVWAEISYRLQELFSVWLEQPARIMNALKEVQRRLFTKVVKRLGWDYPEEEDPAIGTLRALAIRYAGRAGDPEIVAEARRRFRIFMSNRDMSAIPPDLRFPVFEIVLRTTTGVEEYEAIVDYYRETYMPGEKVVALTVLGYGHSPELIHRTLAFAMSPEVRTQDILTAIATLRSSVLGRAELWGFMRRNWDVLYERHCDDIRFLEFFVLLCIGSFSTIERYRECQEFFATKDRSLYERILATCLEERDRKDVELWLRSNGYLTTGLEEDLHLHRERNVLQLQQYQQQHQHQHQHERQQQQAILPQCRQKVGLDLGATVHQMSELMVLSAATVTVAPRTLEGEMELLRVNGEDDY
ncbi:lysine aminopeptidase ApsA [Gamsiella multidivaricata]|uniref:lysine aminopeptidase ApsA n=1 Tax=Gamsiella multidivaricata TaxID=101098 RepID=UPI00221F8C21|nr:lysine aminopeptidase ApsA [Gamsiella multidivaricata]KAI7822147.1 lysine aminopeptidase ApsA [Gamsiella multidivaricata]